jgi:hypothetical protein
LRSAGFLPYIHGKDLRASGIAPCFVKNAAGRMFEVMVSQTVGFSNIAASALFDRREGE